MRSTHRIVNRDRDRRISSGYDKPLKITELDSGRIVVEIRADTTNELRDNLLHSPP